MEFSDVLLVNGENNDLLLGEQVKAVVTAEILGQVQGDKVIAFKMKRRKGFRKKKGFRQHFTKIRIAEIA